MAGRREKGKVISRSEGDTFIADLRSPDRGTLEKRRRHLCYCSNEECLSSSVCRRTAEEGLAVKINVSVQPHPTTYPSRRGGSIQPKKR